MNAEKCCSACKIDEPLRMLFSAPVLTQTRMLRSYHLIIPAFASALAQRTGAQALALSGHPKRLIDFASEYPRYSAFPFGLTSY